MARRPPPLPPTTPELEMPDTTIENPAAPARPTPTTTVPRPGVPKTLTDVGYIAVGLGIMGAQRLNVRRIELQERVQGTGACVQARRAEWERELADRRDAVAARTRHTGDRVAGSVREAGARAETSARTAADRVRDLGDELRGRVEPVVGELRDRVEPVVDEVRGRLPDVPELPELPARVSRVVETSRTRVRALVRPERAGATAAA